MCHLLNNSMYGITRTVHFLIHKHMILRTQKLRAIIHFKCIRLEHVRSVIHSTLINTLNNI